MARLVTNRLLLVLADWHATDQPEPALTTHRGAYRGRSPYGVQVLTVTELTGETHPAGHAP